MELLAAFACDLAGNVKLRMSYMLYHHLVHKILQALFPKKSPFKLCEFSGTVRLNMYKNQYIFVNQRNQNGLH